MTLAHALCQISRRHLTTTSAAMNRRTTPPTPIAPRMNLARGRITAVLTIKLTRAVTKTTVISSNTTPYPSTPTGTLQILTLTPSFFRSLYHRSPTQTELDLTLTHSLPLLGLHRLFPRHTPASAPPTSTSTTVTTTRSTPSTNPLCHYSTAACPTSCLTGSTRSTTSSPAQPPPPHRRRQSHLPQI